MSKETRRQCPQCKEVKPYRSDQKTCGCKAVPVEVSEVKGDKWTISLPKTPIHTLEQLLEHCKVDTSAWEVERFICNKWEVGMKDAAGEPEVIPLFQVKAFLRRKVDVIAVRAEVDALMSLAKDGAPKPPQIKRAFLIPSGNMLEVNLTDHHFGKMAWGVETGWENYDTKIAEKVFWRAFQTILERASVHQFEEIWFVVGNDLLNSDDVEGRTTRGTYVSTDARYQKTFAVVRTVMISAIEQLRQYTPKVKVIMVPGNHDHLSVWHLGDSLECYFHKYKDVEIDNAPKYRKYHQFGKVMILYTHGDKGKRLDLPLLMATEQPEMFGETEFREAHTGHIHTNRVEEQHGIRVRVLSALCPPDAWHAENGFVGNLRASEGFIWNKKEGLIGTVVYTDVVEDIERESK